MVHDEYIKRRDEIMHSLTHELTKKTYLQAQQAIDELVLAVIGGRDDDEKYKDLSKYKQRKVIIEYEQRIKQRSIVKGGE